jgi:8-oxo-dGTP diphosphatase
MKFRDRQGILHTKPEHKPTIKRTSAYGIIIKENKVLLTKPTWINLWDLPGGGADPGETIEQGLKREFIEETSHKIINHNNKLIIKVYNNFYAEDLDKYFDSEMNFFIVNQLEKTNHPIEPNEIKEVSWVDLKQIKPHNMSTDNYAALRKAYQILKGL